MIILSNHYRFGVNIKKISARKNLEHRWDIKPKEASSVQTRLKDYIWPADDFSDISVIAGVDVSIKKKQKAAFCAIVLLSYPQGQVIETAVTESDISYPYIPGLLTFREGPLVLKCFSRLRIIPDIIFFDGQGYAHPRRMGLASHIGILLDIPSIGVAKSKLIGEYRSPGRKKGDFSLLIDKGEVIGVSLRSRDNVKPIFLSVGHRICLLSAIRLVLHTCITRIPEPTKSAHDHLRTLDR